MSINTLPKGPPPINKPSLLLGSDENEILNSLIGSRCVTLATAVVQVILAEPPAYRWVKKHCGVCCFIKDNGKRSYFIRVYDIQKKCLIWEQELYSDFTYCSPHSWFHTFETDDGQAGLNFADENEANLFKGVVLERIRPKRDRKQGRRTDDKTSPVNNNNNGGGVSNITTNTVITAHLPVAEKVDKKKEKKKDKKKAKVTKADIGLPTNFQHVQHVGWDPAKGFDVDLDNIDSSLREFFSKAGISEKQLKDKKTAQFIYDFIDSMGGIENIKNKSVSQPLPSHHSQHGSAPPPVPIRGNMGAPPPPPSRGNMGAPPPPPARNAGVSIPPTSRTGGQPPPPPPTRNLPPIPTSAISPPSIKPPQMRSPPSIAPPSVPSGGGGPPPPPPPPPAVSAPPPPPMPVGGLSGEPLSPPPSSGRGALLEQIRQGMTLTPVEPAPKSSGVGRGELLDQIRQGIELKPLSEAPHSRVTSAQPGELDGMAAALARALAERSKAIHSSDDDDDDEDEEEEDDDEWED